MKISIEINDEDIIDSLQHISNTINVDIKHLIDKEDLTKLIFIYSTSIKQKIIDEVSYLVRDIALMSDIKPKIKKKIIPKHIEIRTKQPLYIRVGELAKGGLSREEIISKLELDDVRFIHSFRYYIDKYPNCNLNPKKYIRSRKKVIEKKKIKEKTTEKVITQNEPKKTFKSKTITVDYSKIFDENGSLIEKKIKKT